MAVTTLGEAISAVPQLGRDCSAVLTVAVPGSGLKLMRLVSRHLRTAMLGVVQGYTLLLDGSSPGLFREMALLEHTSLSHLHVVVKDHIFGVGAQGANHWAALTLSLQCFVYAMANVINSLTHLDIILTSSEGYLQESMTELLSLLAPACPSLLQLQVSGDISRSLLAAFGASCPNLSALKLTASLLTDSLEELQLILPRLTHYCCHLTQGDELQDVASGTGTVEISAGADVVPGLGCLPLLPCKGLTHMDFGLLTLTPEMWHALPRGLQLLRCCVSKSGSTPPAGLRALENLQHIELYCTNTMEVDLGRLVSVLRTAPKARTLTLSSWEKDPTRQRANEAKATHASVGVLCMRDSIPDLIYLHNCVLAGLAVTSTSVEVESFAGVSLTLRSRDRGGQFEEDNISWFLEKLPTFPGFKGLELLYPSNAGHLAPSITEHIAVTFSNLKFLRIQSYPIIDEDLVHLQACVRLQHLLLQGERATVLGLASLCTRLELLEVLQLGRPTACAFDLEAMQSCLQEWGLDVKIIGNQY